MGLGSSAPSVISRVMRNGCASKTGSPAGSPAAGGSTGARALKEITGPHPAAGRRPAVDRQVYARDVGAAVGGQEQRGLGDLLRGAVPRYRDLRRRDFLIAAPQHGGVDRAWLDRIDADVVVPELDRG